MHWLGFPGVVTGWKVSVLEFRADKALEVLRLRV